MNAERTNDRVTWAMIILGGVTALPLLVALWYWCWYLVRQVCTGRLDALARIGLAAGVVFSIAGLMVVGLVLIDRLRVRRDASTSGEGSPLPGLVVIFLGVCLAMASVLKGTGDEKDRTLATADAGSSWFCKQLAAKPD